MQLCPAPGRGGRSYQDGARTIVILADFRPAMTRDRSRLLSDQAAVDHTLTVHESPGRWWRWLSVVIMLLMVASALSATGLAGHAGSPKLPVGASPLSSVAPQGGSRSVAPFAGADAVTSPSSSSSVSLRAPTGSPGSTPSASPHPGSPLPPAPSPSPAPVRPTSPSTSATSEPPTPARGSPDPASGHAPRLAGPNSPETSSAISSWTLSSITGPLPAAETATGGGAVPSSTITFAASNPGEVVFTAAPCTASSAGAFNCALTVKASPNTAQTFTANDGTGPVTSSNAFTAIPTWSLSPTTGTLPAPVTATGTGFASNAGVLFAATQPSQTSLSASPCTSSATGSFSCALTVTVAPNIGETFTATTIATIPVATQPVGLAFDSANNAVYVANNGAGLVSVISEATETVTATIAVGGAPVGVAVDAATNTIYVANWGTNSLDVINGATNSLITTIPVGTTPDGVGVDSATDTIYVANWGSNSVSVIDGATNTVITVVPVGTGAGWFGVDSSTNTIYESNNNGQSVSVLNGATYAVIATIPVQNCPVQVGVETVTNMVYVANFCSDTVSVINGATNSVTNVIPVATSPWGVWVDGATNTVYVTNNNAATLSLIDGATNSVTTTFGVGSNPEGVEMDPSTGNVFVANYGSNSVSVISAATTSSNAFTAAPSWSVSPTSGVLPATLTGTGTGFQPNAAITFAATNPAQVALTQTPCTSNAAGSFSCALTVTVSPNVAETFTAGDGTNTVTSSSGFTASPSWSLTPKSGTLPAAITATGTGFQPNVAITFAATNPTQVSFTQGPCTSSGAGSFSCALSVTSSPNVAEAFTASDGTNTVTTYSVTATINVGINPNQTAVDTVTNTIYVANRDSNSISVVNGATNTVTATIGVGSYPTGVAVDDATDTIFVANWGTNTVTVINGATNTVTATIPVGNNPTRVAVDSSTDTAYVTNFGSNTVGVIDGATNTVTTSIPVGTNPLGVDVDTPTDTVYVTNYGANNVNVINGVTNLVTATIPVGSIPTLVGVDSSTDAIYVANQGSNSVSVINGATDTVTATIPVASNPIGVGVDGPTDTIFVANYGANLLTVINGATNTIAATTQVGIQPVGLSVDPATDTVYVANGGMTTVSVIDGATSAFTALPSWSFSPTSGTLPRALTAAGTGFQANAAVTFAATNPTQVTLTQAPCTSSATGSFSCSLVVTASPNVAETFTAGDGTNTVTSAGGFTAIPSWALTSTAGALPATITAAGSGFQPNAAITFAATNPTQVTFTQGPCTSSATGSFSCALTVTASPNVAETFTAADGVNTVTSSDTFTATPSWSVSPPNGVLPATLTATGTGFKPNAAITFAATNPAQVTFTQGPCTSSATGSFSCSLVVTAAPRLGETFTANDGTNTVTSSNTFTATSSLTLSVTAGVVGTALTVSGTGFAPGPGTVTVSWTDSNGNTASVCSGVVLSATGSFSCIGYTLPPSTFGLGTFAARDSSGSTASTTFLILPAVLASPTTGSAGTVVTFSGNGFSPNSALVIAWSGNAFGSPTCPATTDGFGSFTCTPYTSPAMPTGTYTFNATDGSGHARQATFTVTPSLVVSLTHGPVGTWVGLQAHGFAGGSSGRMSYVDHWGNLHTVCQGVPVAANGSFSCTWVIPPSTGSVATFSAGDSSGNLAKVLFDVTPSLVTFPVSASYGSSVTWYGSGYNGAGQVVSIYWSGNGTHVCTGVANVSGSFTCGFTLLEAPFGRLAVNTTDAYFGAWGVGALTVLESLFVSPASGPVGTTLTVYGFGWYSADFVTVLWGGQLTICSQWATLGTNGTFVCSVGQGAGFTVPATPAGPVTIQANDKWGGNDLLDTVTFTVTTNLAVSLTGSPAPTDVGVAATFTAVASGGAGSYTNYAFDFGDGFTASGTSATATHTYAQAGTYPVRVVVTDAYGSQVSTLFTEVVHAAPSVSASGTPDPTDLNVAVAFSASVSGGTGAVGYLWNFGDLTSSTAANPAHIYAAVGSYTVTLTLTDAVGAKATTSFTVVVNPDPVASWTASPTTTDLGMAVAFSGSVSGGTGAITYAWTFGDGGTASGASPVHTYATSGTFTTALTVCDALLRCSTATSPIVVNARPSVSESISADPTDAGVAVAFTGSVAGGTGPYSWFWTFGDGSTSTLASPSHAYATPGSYLVSVTVTDAVGSSTSGSSSLTVVALPTVSPAASPTTTDVGLGVTFASGLAGGVGPFTYAWNFGDATTSTAASPTHAYAASGSYTVSLVVTDSLGQGTTGTLAVLVNALPSVAPTATPGTTDVGMTVSFASFASGGTGALTYAWEFGDGTTSALGDPTHPYIIGGTYSVTLTATDSRGVSTTGAVSVTVNSLPSVVASASPDPTDVGVATAFSAVGSGGTGSLTYAWTFGNGAASALQNPTYVYPASGTYTVRLVATDALGGSGSTTFTEQVNAQPSGVVLSASAGALDYWQSTNLTVSASGGTGSYSYSYSGLPAGCLSVSAPTLTCSPRALGSFSITVTVTDPVGGSGTSNALTLIVRADPSVSSPLATPAAVDVSQTTWISVVPSGGYGSWTYLWSGLPAGCLSANLATIACTPTVAGTYTVGVRVVDGLGGTNSSSAIVLVVSTLPSVSLLSVTSSSIDVGQTTTLSAAVSGGARWTSLAWNGLPPGCPSSNASVLSCTPTSSGAYAVSVTATDANGGSASSTAWLLTVSPALAGLSLSPSTTTLDVGQGLAFVASVSGGSGGLLWSWAGLPAGCFGSALASVSCVPTTAGSTNVTVSVSDSSGASLTSSKVAITVFSALLATPAAASAGSVDLGQSLTFSTQVSGGEAPYVYTWTGLPAGCASANAAQLSCTPTVVGSYQVSVGAKDANGDRVDATAVPVQVLSALGTPTLAATLSTLEVGLTTDLGVSVSGGHGPYTYAWSGLPVGCAPANSPALACAPTSAGSASVAVTVTDANGASTSSNALALSVAPALSVTASSNRTSTFPIGGSVAFHASASGGVGTVAYTWWLNGSLVQGASTAWLNLTDLKGGTYTVAVTVTDGAGVKVTSDAVSATSELKSWQITAAAPVGPTAFGWAQLLLLLILVVLVLLGLVLLLLQRRRSQPTKEAPKTRARPATAEAQVVEGGVVAAPPPAAPPAPAPRTEPEETPSPGEPARGNDWEEDDEPQTNEMPGEPTGNGSDLHVENGA